MNVSILNMINFKLAKVIGKGVGAAQAHVFALVQKKYLVSTLKKDGAFLLVE